MSSQSVPCISTGTTLHNRYLYKAFTSFIILSRTCSINIATAEFNILELVLVVFSLDKEILKWLSICPKYSRKLPKSFFYDRKKIQKQKHRPKMRKMFSFLFEWLKKTKFKERNYRLGSLIQVESGKVDLSECTKLSIDERLVAPDPDMLGYRTFVVI